MYYKGHYVVCRSKEAPFPRPLDTVCSRCRLDGVIFPLGVHAEPIRASLKWSCLISATRLAAFAAVNQLRTRLSLRMFAKGREGRPRGERRQIPLTPVHLEGVIRVLAAFLGSRRQKINTSFSLINVSLSLEMFFITPQQGTKSQTPGHLGHYVGRRRLHFILY